MAVMRIKSHWFREGQARDPAEIATAMAAIVWRAGDNRLKNLRKGGFEIAAGPAYVDILAELLVFLVVVADRIAYRHDAGAWRTGFTAALALRVGDLLQDSFDDLLGPAPGRGYKARFIDLLNERASEYAQYEYRDDGPEFAFLRHFGNRLTEAMPDEFDRRWALDQAMTVEGPECVEIVEKAMRGVLGKEPKPRRAREGGE